MVSSMSTQMVNRAGQSECQAAQEHLARTGYFELRGLHVTSGGAGHLRIDGAVKSFYLKQVAQEALLRLGDIRQLDNNLTVAGVFA